MNYPSERHYSTFNLPSHAELYRTLDSLSSELRSLTNLSYVRRLLENQDHAQKLSGYVAKVNESILDYMVTIFC
jgi:hypothetical protein